MLLAAILCSDLENLMGEAKKDGEKYFFAV